MKTAWLTAATTFLFACGAASPEPGTPTPAAQPPGSEPPASTAKQGKTFASPEEAPVYPGTAFAQMQIIDLESGLYLDEVALLEALDAVPAVFMGEQHETAPVQELELWLLRLMTARHADLALAMEHFQHDEQPIIDNYLAGQITSAQFENTSQPWPRYAQYWKPLVEHMKEQNRAVLALNVPSEALNTMYSAYPKKPLAIFNGWNDSFKYAKDVAPRPLPSFPDAYKTYFAGSFDYASHGQQMGMTEPEALAYFTELAHIRDETMAYFVAQGLAAHGHVLTVAGDWHVQTGLALADRLPHYAEGARSLLVTTTPAAKLDEVRSKNVAGRKLARFVLVYEVP